MRQDERWLDRPPDALSEQQRENPIASGRRREASTAGSQLGACSEVTMAATGPFIQIRTIFPRTRVWPASFNRWRIGCSATPPGVEPQGCHAADQTSHDCMMKPIWAASSSAQQPKQR